VVVFVYPTGMRPGLDVVGQPPRRPRVRLLHPVGGTVRLLLREPGAGSPRGAEPALLPRVLGALVVGSSLSCHFWLSILPLARGDGGALRCYIREADLAVLGDRLHVPRPAALPAFLVFVDGFAVDAFPAPLPAGEPTADPLSLIAQVRERLRRYG
jgi:hypothetical protein